MPGSNPRPLHAGPAPGRILIVRPSALGDVSRTVPCLASLRQAFPDATIDWLVNDAFADVIRHHPMLNSVVPFHRRDMTPTRAWSLGRRLRRGGYDLAIDLQGLLRSGICTRLTAAPKRLGFANAREGAALAYNIKHPVDRALHTVDRMLALLDAAGIPPVHDMRLHVGPDDRAWLDTFIAQHGLGAGYTCIAPTAKWLCKCWPIERYAEVARALDGPVVVLAAPPEVAPAEAAYVRPLLDALGDRAVLPRTTVGQLMAVLSRTRLLLCNDSAALHIAVGLDRPAVAVFGPTDPALVGPYRRPNAVVQPPDVTPADLKRYRAHRDDPSLIARVSVDQVRQRITEICENPPS